jgi:hypothetical protein
VNTASSLVKPPRGTSPAPQSGTSSTLAEQFPLYSWLRQPAEVGAKFGIEVVGREADYDTSSDPIVRTTVTETRKHVDPGYGIMASLTQNVMERALK